MQLPLLRAWTSSERAVADLTKHQHRGYGTCSGECEGVRCQVQVHQAEEGNAGEREGISGGEVTLVLAQAVVRGREAGVCVQ